MKFNVSSSFLDSASNAPLRILDSLHLVIQSIPEKKLILYLCKFSTHLMIVGSNLQVSFLEHRLLEEKASSFGRFWYFGMYFNLGNGQPRQFEPEAILVSVLTLSSNTCSFPSLPMWSLFTKPNYSWHVLTFRNTVGWWVLPFVKICVEEFLIFGFFLSLLLWK